MPYESNITNAAEKQEVLMALRKQGARLIAAFAAVCILLMMCMVLGGCAQAGDDQGKVEGQGQNQQNEVSGDAAQGTSPDAADGSTGEDKEGRVLLAYFSRAGENYQTESTEVGNTAVVAGFIEDALGCDAYEIVAEEAYPFGYEDTKVRAQQELDDDARPALANAVPDVADYDVILLGCPIWYGSEPMAIRTFLESGDFSGKTIVPFTTHGGSGLGGVVSNYKELVPDATVSSEGLAITGSQASKSKEQIASWLSKLGLM